MRATAPKTQRSKALGCLPHSRITVNANALHFNFPVEETDYGCATKMP